MASINDALEKEVENYECSLNSTAEVRVNGNSDKYEYVKLMRNTFDRKLFPSNFDEWTVSQRYNWINKNLSKFYPNVPESLLELIPAFFCQEDCDRSPVEKPEWLDMDKYRKGQKFVQDYFFSVNVTAPLALIPFYTFDSINATILNGLSHTPCLAFKRNMTTVCRMMNWFTGEPWIKGTPAFKDMQAVRKIHVMIRNKLSRLNNHEIANACKFENPWCPDRELLLKDFAEACPFEKIGQRPYKSFADLPSKPKHVNNADIAMGQACFVSLILLYPQDFGVHNATDEDFEAYCHLWRCYGYYLGIKDEYNICRGSLGEIKQRVQDLYQYWVIPNFKEVTPEWEHMTRCIMEPFRHSPMYMSYKMAVLFITDLLGMNMSRLYTSLSYREWIAHKIWKFVMRYAFKLSSIRSLVNKTMFGGMKKLMNFTPEEKAQMYMQFEKKIQNSSFTI